MWGRVGKGWGQGGRGKGINHTLKFSVPQVLCVSFSVMLWGKQGMCDSDIILHGLMKK